MFWTIFSVVLTIFVNLVYFSVSTKDEEKPFTSLDRNGCLYQFIAFGLFTVGTPLVVGLFRLALRFATLGEF